MKKTKWTLVLLLVAVACCALAFAACKNEGGDHKHKMVRHAAVAAKCTKDGNKEYWSCGGCNKNFADAKGQTELTDIVVPMLGHDVANYSYNNDASCTKAGTKTGKCNRCDETVTADDAAHPMLDHVFTEYTPNNDATCTKAGNKTATCDNGCGATDVIKNLDDPAKEHDFMYQSNNDATCLHDGTKTGKCSRCDEVDTAVAAGSKLKHKFVDGECTACEMPESAYTATYTISGDYIYFGSYPQAQESDTAITEQLDEKAGALPTAENSGNWIDYGYYCEGDEVYEVKEGHYMWYQDVIYNKEIYRGVYFTYYRPIFTDGELCDSSTVDGYSISPTRVKDNGYETSTVYWFKYEPLKWRILENNGDSMFIMCDTIIDSQEFYHDIFSVLNSNDWEFSNIRKWLNRTFYELAFNDLQKALIATTLVKNGADTVEGGEYNEYIGNDTEDKIFLLSYADLFNTAYFPNADKDKELSPEAAIGTASDYALIQGLATEIYTYWLRSPYPYDMGENYAHAPGIDVIYAGNEKYHSPAGAVGSDIASYTWNGVVPVLYISFATQGLKYELSADGTYYIVSKGDFNGGKDLTIPAHYNGLPVKEIAAEGFMGNAANAPKITIPASITKIGMDAFSPDRYTLNSVERIVYFEGDVAAWCAIEFEGKSNGEGAFSYNSNPLCYYGGALYIGGALVEDLELPEGLAEVKPYAFINCNSIKSLITHGAAIGTGAFTSCGELATVTINGGSIGVAAFRYSGIVTLTVTGVEEIGANAFNACQKNNVKTLTSVTLTGVKNIGSGAFEVNTKLETVTLPAGLLEIGDKAFRTCSALTSVTIPASITTIGASAFEGCTALQSEEEGETGIHFGGTKAEWTALEKGEHWNAYYSGGYKELAMFIYCSDGTLPENEEPDPGPEEPGLGELEYTLSGNCYIVSGIGTYTGTEIIIPSTYKGLPVTEIAERAFISNNNITKVVIPNSVTKLNGMAFKWCESIQTVEIGNGLTTIGNQTFYECTSVTSITIAEGATLIGQYMFYKTAITEVVLPASVKTINQDAFDGCASLEYVIMGGEVSIGSWAFLSCNKLSAIYCLGADRSQISISSGNNPLTNATWYYYSETKPTETTTDAEGNLVYVEKLWHYDANGEIEIWEYIPEASAGLTYTLNGDYYTVSLGSCTETEIFIASEYEGKPVKEIAANGFKDSSIVSIFIPKSITTIGEYAFENCTALEKLNIPNTVTTLGNSAFKGCTALENVKIGSGLSSIGANAFSGCTALSSVTFNEGLTLIGNSAFYNCTSLTEITLPESVETIDQQAFRGCSKLEVVNIGGNVTKIGNMAFMGCLGLQVPETGFDDETGIHFNGTKSEWTEIEKGSNWDIKSLGGDGLNYYLYFTAESTAMEVGGSSTGEVIPAGLKYELSADGTYYIISMGTFKGTELIIPSTHKGLPVGEIGANGFKGSALVSVVIPASVTNIGTNAFDGSKSLVSVTLSVGLKTIGGQAFANCSALTSLILPDGLETVDELGSTGVFENCYALEYLVIPSSVTFLGKYLIYGTSNVKIYYKGSAEQWAAINKSTSNSHLESAPKFYYSEEKPAENVGNFWRYVEGVPTVWTDED